MIKEKKFFRNTEQYIKTLKTINNGYSKTSVVNSRFFARCSLVEIKIRNKINLEL